MKSGHISLDVSLSHLIPSRRNPRKLKPGRQSHERLVALIRTYGLLQPLVVRPIEGKPKHYEVVAGHRRLKALQEIHGKDGKAKIPCVLRNVDAETAAALSLGENFGQEPMHPLDEAEAFAGLVSSDGKDAQAIAAEFGVTEHYVRQRMKLASLAEIVKNAYRSGEINTATAEVFASVPEDRQIQVWQEMDGHPSHAEHVRNVIAHDWIDASHALFELSSIPDSVVSRDLFSERVLIERKTFMAAQIEALGAERIKLVEEGWREVVADRYEEIHDRSLTMEPAEREFDEQTSRKLAKLEERREKLDTKLQEIPDESEKALNATAEKLEALDAEEQQIRREAPVSFSEETKAMATVFLMLSPDGQVRREYRIPRRRPGHSVSGSGHSSDGSVVVYVWVFTTAEDVVYIYRPTREGEFLTKLLAGFKGVLVTDFYAAYDALPCPQQKCLIHLMRDMNQELLNNPFDQELQSITGPFGVILRDVATTIDQYGLQRGRLQKHRPQVNEFFHTLGSSSFRSEAAESVRARLTKYQGKLFTFLAHDGVPWNNNNAENAIRRFAYYRDDIPGLLRENGLKDYLTLLSVCHTCHYRGVSFLRFLLSRERDMESFCRSGNRKRLRLPPIELYPPGIMRPDFRRMTLARQSQRVSVSAKSAK